MSDGPAFHQTRMGVRHYERTMPELVKQLTRLNDLIDRLLQQRERERERERDPVAAINESTTATRTEPSR